MKKTIIILLVLFIPGITTKIFSQSIAPSVLNNGGGSSPAGGYIIEFNIGEMMAIQTVTTPGLIVTQGLLQPFTDQISLPVTLILFQGKKMNQYNELKWKTAYETGYTVFELQRSADAQHFTTIYTTPAIGSATGSTYGYNDYQSFSGNVFYRLRMTEAGLPDRFSQVIVLSDEEETHWTAYPNPVNRGGMLNINIQNSGTVTNSSVELYDVSGHQLLNRKETIITGSQVISLPVNLVPGTYILKVTGFGKDSFQKIIVQ